MADKSDIKISDALAGLAQIKSKGIDTEIVEKGITSLLREHEALTSEFSDIQVMYETTLEHSTEIENEISVKNDQITELMGKMRKYLSSQLYDLIVHGGVSDDTASNRRKKLTIFFSDIVGFTDLTDSVEPELLSQLLNNYLDVMAGCVKRYGGTIDKYIGDAIMVYFGDKETPNEAQEARNCVLMALEMQTLMHTIREEWKKQGINHHLQIRIGINTGYCTVGNFGSSDRMDYTIIGGQVNAAARLEHISENGGITISESTYLLVEDLVECEHRGKIQVKGIQRPIDTYQVIGKKRTVDDANALLSKRKEGFILASMQFDRLKASRIEKNEMINALESALNELKKA